MANFTHQFLPNNSLKRIDTPNGRFYKTEDGFIYPSVTTVLSKLSEKSINDWTEQVGEEFAQQKQVRSRKRGTAVHDVLEKYLLNQKINKLRTIPTTYNNYLVAKPYLDKHITTIFGIEHFIYSHELQSAGATDVICLWDNKLSIVDFKNSEKKKQESWITNYIYQVTAYGIMIEELYDLNIEQTIIMNIVDNQKEPQLFINKLEKYKKDTIDFFNENRYSIR